ncbi:MAG: hypothetical protein HY580_01720 [Nitrospinae bacterium]|nr:hypothetical protein [Nitrospinota bacterium]
MFSFKTVAAAAGFAVAFGLTAGPSFAQPAPDSIQANAPFQVADAKEESKPKKGLGKRESQRREKGEKGKRENRGRKAETPHVSGSESPESPKLPGAGESHVSGAPSQGHISGN